jgi:hypothetical protein
LAVDEVIVKFKGWVSSGSTFPKKGNVSVSKFTNCLMAEGIRTT